MFNASFKKIITFYTILTLTAIIALSVTFQYMIYSRSKNNALHQNTIVNNAIVELVYSKYTHSTNSVSALYANTNYQETVITLLDVGIDNFFNYSLDQFYITNLSPMRLLRIYFENIVNFDSSIERISLYSNNDFMYTYQRRAASLSRCTPEVVATYGTLIHNLTLSGDFPLIPYNNAHDIPTFFDIIIPIQDATTLANKGHLIVTYNITPEIDTILATADSSYIGTLSLIHKNGSVLYSTAPNTLSQSIIDSVIPTDSITHAELSQLNPSLWTMPLGDTGLFLVNEIPPSLMYKHMIPTILIIFLVTLASIGLILLLTLTYSAAYSSRLKTITRAIDTLKSGDFSSRIQIAQSQDELTTIAANFNDMCNEIEDYIDKVYALQLKQKEAELESLQTQINPHFLYNTLENIRMRAAINNDMDVSQMIYILATFFRKSLNYDTIITLDEEMNHSRLYLQLFQIQYMDKLHIESNIDPSLLHYTILKLTIQPIVENYIIHGIDLTRNDNKVTINATQKEGDIWIEISDNGTGIPDETLKNIRASLNHRADTRHIGLINVHERLQLQYGTSYGLLIDSKLKQGTTVTLHLPCQER